MSARRQRGRQQGRRASADCAPISSPKGTVCRLRLRCAAEVAVVESADLGQGNDAAVLGQLDRAWLGRILLEREVRRRAVVVAEVAAQTTTEVSLAQMEERAPGLRGRFRATRHQPGNRALRDLEAELEPANHGLGANEVGAPRPPAHWVERHIQRSRSRRPNCGRFDWRRRRASCCQSARFSSARSVRVLRAARRAPDRARTRDVSPPWLARRSPIVQSRDRVLANDSIQSSSTVPEAAAQTRSDHFCASSATRAARRAPPSNRPCQDETGVRDLRIYARCVSSGP